MAQDRTKAFKKIESEFLLDSSKLRRLVTVIEQKFSALGPPIEHFQITLRSGKDVSIEAVEAILEHDNTVKNPIDELSIKVAEEDGPSEVSISFDRKGDEIHIHAHSDDARWTSEIFGEIEEQIERSFLSSWIDALRGLLMLTLFIGAIPLVASLVSPVIDRGVPRDSEARRLLLDSAAANSLVEVARSANTLEDRVEFLFRFHAAQVEALNSDRPMGRGSRLVATITGYGWRAVLVALPAVIILVAAFYLLFFCYPGSVFAWGDYGEHYKSLVERRRFLMGTIVVALMVGVVANLAVYAAASQFLGQ